MTRDGIMISALAVLLGISGSMPAYARVPARKHDPECLWQQMSTKTRSALVTAYATGGADSLDSVSLSDSAIASIAHSCGIRRKDDASLRNAGAAIAGIALQHAAGQRLTAMGVPVERLDRAWAKARADEKDLVLANVSGSAEGDRESARRFFQAVLGLVRRAGAPLRPGLSPVEDKSIRPYIDWFLGHAQALHFWAVRP